MSEMSAMTAEEAAAEEVEYKTYERQIPENDYTKLLNDSLDEMRKVFEGDHIEDHRKLFAEKEQPDVIEQPRQDFPQRLNQLDAEVEQQNQNVKNENDVIMGETMSVPLQTTQPVGAQPAPSSPQKAEKAKEAPKLGGTNGWLRVGLLFSPAYLLLLWRDLTGFVKTYEKQTFRYYVIPRTRLHKVVSETAAHNPIWAAKNQFEIVVVWKKAEKWGSPDPFGAQLIMLNNIGLVSTKLRELANEKAALAEMKSLSLRESGILEVAFSPGMSNGAFNGLHFKYFSGDVNKDVFLTLLAFTAMNQVDDDVMFKFPKEETERKTFSKTQLKVIREWIAKSARVRRARDKRTLNLPGTTPISRTKLVSSTAAPGLFQDLLDYYALELVADHHTLRLSPSDAILNAGAKPRLDPAYDIHPTRDPALWKTGASAKGTSARDEEKEEEESVPDNQKTTSAEFNLRQKRDAYTTWAPSGALPLAVRRLMERQSAAASAFVRFVQSPEGQLLKIFMFYYVFCAMELFHTQRYLLFNHLAVDDDVFHIDRQTRDAFNEHQFYVLYSKLMYSPADKDNIVDILRMDFGSLLKGDKDAREKAQFAIQQELDLTDKGFSQNIMPLGTIMDRVHNVLCMYGFPRAMSFTSGQFIVKASEFADKITGMLDSFKITANEKTEKAFAVAVEKKSSAEVVAAVTALLNGALAGKQGVSASGVGYALSLLEKTAGALANAYSAFLEFATELSELNLERFSEILYTVKDWAPLQTAVEAWLRTRVPIVRNNADAAKRTWDMLSHLPQEKVEQGIQGAVRVPKLLAVQALTGVNSNPSGLAQDTIFYALWKISESAPRHSRFADAEFRLRPTSESGTYTATQAGLTGRTLAGDLIQLIENKIRREIDRGNIKVLKPDEPDIFVRNFVINSLARDLKVSEVDLKVDPNEITISSVREDIKSLLDGTASDPYACRNALQNLWKSKPTIEKMDHESLLMIYKSLILGHYELSNALEKISTRDRTFAALGMKLMQLFDAYSKLRSVYVIQAKKGGEIAEISNELIAKLEVERLSNEEEKKNTVSIEEKFWNDARGDPLTYQIFFTTEDNSKTATPFDPSSKKSVRSRLLRSWLYDIGSIVKADVELMRKDVASGGKGVCGTEGKTIFDEKSQRIEMANIHLYGVRAWKHWGTFLAKHVDFFFPTVKMLRVKDEDWKNIPELTDAARASERERTEKMKRRMVLGGKEWVEVTWESGAIDFGRPEVSAALSNILQFMLKVAGNITPVASDAMTQLVKQKIIDWCIDIYYAYRAVLRKGDVKTVAKLREAAESLKELYQIFANAADLEKDSESTPKVGLKAVPEIKTSLLGRGAGSFLVLAEKVPDGYIVLLKTRQLFADVLKNLIDTEVDRKYVRELLLDYNMTSGVMSYLFSPPQSELDKGLISSHLRGVPLAFSTKVRGVSMFPPDVTAAIQQMDKILKRASDYTAPKTTATDTRETPEEIRKRTRGARDSHGFVADSAGNAMPDRPSPSRMDISE